MHHRYSILAFSLVELSIVLVILGLLIGGILAGRSLIRASELRAIGTEYTRYQTAAAAFKDKYFSIPGDMAIATKFWGKSATDCNSHTGNVATPGTCNGNGDGQIGYASGSAEMFRFWQQLALAGLIEGTYDGLSSNGSATDDGSDTTNSPISKYQDALWAIVFATGGDSTHFDMYYGHRLTVGGYSNSSSPPITRIFSAEELWNIDTKLDDGMPGAGNIITWRYYDCTTAANNTNFNATYNFTSIQKCNPIFRNFL